MKSILPFLLLLISSSQHVNAINIIGGGNNDNVDKEAEVVVVKAKTELKKSALMGKLFPMFSNLFVRREGSPSFKQVFNALADLVDEREFALFAMIGWGLVPVTKSVYDVYANVTGRGLEGEDDEEDVDEGKPLKARIREAYEVLTPWDDEKLAASLGREVVGKEELGKKKAQSDSTGEGGVKRKKLTQFRDTLVFQVVDHISQASKISLAVVVVDCLALIGKMMGYNYGGLMGNAPRIFSKVVITGWIASRLSVFKRYFLKRALPDADGNAFDFASEVEDMGKLNVVDNLLNGVLYTLWLLHLLDFLEVETGFAVKSLFSLGATGTLVFGLASKDLASQLISGLTLHLSEKMYEGDDVRFSDGTTGKITQMGWMETAIRNSDELTVRIPNTELAGQRVYNLSRTPRSQVTQTLRISYDDAAKIPLLLTAIKEEIKTSCPKLITDGSRSFRANWRNYEDDHLQVVVDCHFTIKPTGDEYWDNRQSMLEAIYRAVKKTGVHFEKAVRV
mmetsp:Transcript_5255/g.11626  ORF Transcript_5255/g.11626 Transcript_5255/m.11626 type:complete len:507 (+) Transcript_5255:69-1589(+)